MIQQNNLNKNNKLEGVSLVQCWTWEESSIIVFEVCTIKMMRTLQLMWLHLFSFILIA